MPRQISARIGAAGCTRQAAALLGALAAVGASAGISTDGTVGPATTLAGPDFRVGAELGTIRGTNLFHSFRVFNVLTGESATFTGPGRIANVIARVTGGSASNIDGLLRSQVGLADFYFINPAGVVLGPNAQVDVPAAFHASTADELRFKDGSRYSATDPGASSLTVAAPAAFGFLAARPASLKVNGSLLESGPGGRISLSGGNLRAQGAVLSAPGGRIDLTAVGGPAELPVDRPLATQASGRLTLEGTWIDSSGAGGGAASLRAGRLVLKGSGIYGDNTARGAASGGIDIGVGSLRLDDSIVAADASGAGRSAPVSVAVAEDAVLARYSSILSQTPAGPARSGWRPGASGSTPPRPSIPWHSARATRARSGSPPGAGSGSSPTRRRPSPRRSSAGPRGRATRARLGSGRGA
jgi:filamentous hemagglutinin family protein